MRKVAMLALLAAAPALPWGGEGHRLVARIAETRLTPAARAAVQMLLPEGQTLPDIASWADEFRRTHAETEGWHYIDIPISRPHLDMARDCPNGNCIVTKITEFRGILADKDGALSKRREALLYLVHFLGDLHQPLHCSDDGDKGGNLVAVIFLGDRMNLHRVWDSALLNHMPPEDELFAKLSQAVTPDRMAVWSRGSVEDWAEEGHQIAKTAIYAKLPPGPKSEPAPLGDTYFGFAAPIVEEQIEKAAARLAYVLNAALL
ncbi:MAG TPA: S1/P1 nuclease [Bryobacteraceae bacterium]